VELADALERNARRAAASAAGPSIAMGGGGGGGGGGGLPTVSSMSSMSSLSMMSSLALGDLSRALTKGERPGSSLNMLLDGVAEGLGLAGPSTSTSTAAALGDAGELLPGSTGLDGVSPDDRVSGFEEMLLEGLTCKMLLEQLAELRRAEVSP